VVAPARRPLVATFRLLTALAAATGVAVYLFLGSPPRILSYFTIQSNILLALVMMSSARRAWTARRPLPGALAGATLFYVVISALVYHLRLANTAPPFSMTGEPTARTAWLESIAHHTLHTATPIAAVLDWLLFTPSGRLHLRQAITWLLYPLTYLAFSLARGELLLPGTQARYLYPFLDVDQHGYKSVLGNALLLGLSFYALALLLVALDHARPDPTRYRRKTGFRLRPPVG
jgi:hypothetical protein